MPLLSLNPVANVVFMCANDAEQDVAKEMQKVIDGYIKFANSSDEAYAHIEAEVNKTHALCAVAFSFVMYVAIV